MPKMPEAPKVQKVAEMAKFPEVISSLEFSEGFCPLSSAKRELCRAKPFGILCHIENRKTKKI